MINQKTAILIFANTASREGKLKSFRRSAILFDELNRQTLKKVEQSKLPYFLFSENEQIGNTFGERYTNAIQFVYDQGFENVITIGNDTPQLKTSQLIETASLLEASPIVLGPSTDGGFYLLGLHRSHFNTQVFLKLPWKTSKLTKSITKLLLAKKVEVIFLKTLSDIDGVSDLQHLLKNIKNLSEKLLKIIHSVFLSENNIFSKNTVVFSLFLKNPNFNKGSPSPLF